MSETNKKEASNRVNLRITDKTVLTLLADLYASPAFKSQTEVLNIALFLGVNELYSDTFGRKKTAAPSGSTVGAVESDNAGKDIKSIKITLDQNAVSLSICEKLLTVIYNLEAAKADGIEVNPELFTSGVLDQLPARLEAARQDMVKAEFQKRRKI
jgi:hypothetical protein